MKNHLFLYFWQCSLNKLVFFTILKTVLLETFIPVSFKVLTAYIELSLKAIFLIYSINLLVFTALLPTKLRFSLKLLCVHSEL